MQQFLQQSDRSLIPHNTSDTVTPFIASGNWGVTSLVQRTEDKTSQFSGYAFKFTSTGADNGTVSATRNGATVSGYMEPLRISLTG